MIYLSTVQFGWLMGLVGFFSACTFCLFFMLYVKEEYEQPSKTIFLGGDPYARSIEKTNSENTEKA